MYKNQSFKRNDPLREKTVAEIKAFLIAKQRKRLVVPATPLQTGVAIAQARSEEDELLADQLAILSDAEMGYIEKILDSLKGIKELAAKCNENSCLLRRGLPRLNLGDAGLLYSKLEQLQRESECAINRMGVVHRRTVNSEEQANEPAARR